MNPEHIRHLLESLRRGEVTTEEVLEHLKRLPFEDMGFVKIDHHRGLRNGCPEVIYGEGKTPGQVAEIFFRLAACNPNVLCTRADPAAAEAVRRLVPEACYHESCRLIEIRRAEAQAVGLVAVAAAGTSDVPISEEAAVTLEVLGSRVERLYDVGVAGIHRLLHVVACPCFFAHDLSLTIEHFHCPAGVVRFVVGPQRLRPVASINDGGPLDDGEYPFRKFLLEDLVHVAHGNTGSVERRQPTLAGTREPVLSDLLSD